MYYMLDLLAFSFINRIQLKIEMCGKQLGLFKRVKIRIIYLADLAKILTEIN